MMGSSKCLCLCYFLIFCSIDSVKCFKILIVDIPPARSHHNLGLGLAEILTDRGHEVTYVSSFPTKNAKFHDVPIVEIQELHNDTSVSISNYNEFKAFAFVKVTNWVIEMNKRLMNHPDFKKILNGGHFDAVILEHFLNDALIGLGVRFLCPVILLSPTSMSLSTEALTENISMMTRVPNVISTFTMNMNLWERIVNTFMYLGNKFLLLIYFDPCQKSFYEEHLPNESKLLPYNELYKIVAGALVNTHPSLGAPRSYLPNVVEVAGFHIREEHLPKDIREFIENAEEGVIYFSLGSNVQSRQMSNGTINEILEVFDTFSHQMFMWKFEEEIEGLPNNVLIRKWFPQNAILAHPKVRVFITHGGLLSYTEAVHFGVPTIIIPIFGDQFHNAYTAQKMGHSIVLEYQNITAETLSWALREMLTNNKYIKNAIDISKIYHDRPVSPAKSVIFHVEHIIKTMGAHHLTPSHMSTFMLFGLDIILLFLGIIICIVGTWHRLFLKKAINKKKPEKKNIKKD